MPGLKVLRITMLCNFIIVMCASRIFDFRYLISPETADISKDVTDFFFIFAASNSCMNPLIYGAHRVDCGKVVEGATTRWQGHRGTRTTEVEMKLSKHDMYRLSNKSNGSTAEPIARAGKYVVIMSVTLLIKLIIRN